MVLPNMFTCTCIVDIHLIMNVPRARLVPRHSSPLCASSSSASGSNLSPLEYSYFE